MSLFVRLTLGIAAVLIALTFLVFVLKLLIVAAVIAAFVAVGIVAVAALRRRFARRPGGQEITLTRKQTKAYSVFEREEIEIAAGDKLPALADSAQAGAAGDGGIEV